MKKQWKRIVTLLLVCLMVFANVQAASAAEAESQTMYEEGTYILSVEVDSRNTFYGYATLSVKADNQMTLTLYIKNSYTNVRYAGGEEISAAGEANEINGITYVPYEIPLTGKTDSIALEGYVPAMGRWPEITAKLSGWEMLPTVLTAPEGTNASVSAVSESGTVLSSVYGQAEAVAEGEAIKVTIYSSAEKVMYQGQEIPQDTTKKAFVAPVNGKNKTFAPYTFVLADKAEEQQVILSIAMGANVRDTNTTLTFSGSDLFGTTDEPEAVQVPVTAASKNTGKLSDRVYEQADVVSEGGSYKVTVYSSAVGISYNGQEIAKDDSKEAVEKEGEVFTPYTFVLLDKSAEQPVSISLQMGDTVRAVEYILKFDSELFTPVKPDDDKPAEPDDNKPVNPDDNKPAEPDNNNPGSDVTQTGRYKITVANASTSSYGKTTVYPEAELELKADGTMTITVLLKDSITNIRTAEGVSVPAGEAKKLTMGGEEGTYYPYTFPVANRQAVLKVIDDVPAMSGVESMNYGRDMTTTINLDWTSVEGLEQEALADGYYELPVAFSSASSMITLADKANVLVKDGAYELRLYFPAGTVTALKYGDQNAELVKGPEQDTFVLKLDSEDALLPVKISVAKMAGTAMAEQSFNIVPEWTKAVETEYKELDRSYAGTSTNTANKPSTIKKPSSAANKKTSAIKKNTTPKTGDAADVMMPLMMAACSVLLAAVIVWKKHHEAVK